MDIYRRKRRPVPVSFFAFQDIITALAGSMLIFVLALAAAKSRSGNDSSGGGMADRSEYDLLQSRFKLNSTLLAEEEKKVAALRRNFDREKRNEQALEQRKRLENSCRKLEKIAGERKKMLDDIQRQSASQQKKNQALAAEKPTLSMLITQADELETQYAAQRSKLLFADSKIKQNIILTTSCDAWYLQTAVGKSPELLGNSVDSMSKLQEKLHLFDAQTTRLIIAVRPSAGGFIEQLKNKLQQKFPAMEIIAEPLTHETSGGVEL